MSMQPKTSGADSGEFKFIDIESLVESETNPRTDFDDTYIGELAASIKQQGIVQPITVRRSQASGRADKFEIVIGACRYRGAKQAGLATVPSLVRALGDEQVLEIQIIENLQRRDVHPLDESSGYQRLIELGKFTAEQIGEKVGKSEEYVRQRMKLATLIESAKKSFRAGAISTEHALLLSRLEPKDQAEGLSRSTKSWQPYNVRELRLWVKERDDVAKKRARIATEIENAKKNGQQVVKVMNWSPTKTPAGVSVPGTFMPAGKTKCDHLALGFYVGRDGGDSYEGRSEKVCTAPEKCSAHSKVFKLAQSANSTRASKPKAAKKKTPAQLLALRKERAVGIARDRAIALVTTKTTGLFEEQLKAIVAAFAGAIWHQKAKELIERRGWPLTGYNIRDGIAKKAASMSRRELLGLVVDLTITEEPTSLAVFAKATNVNIATLERQALAELNAKVQKPRTNIQKTERGTRRVKAKKKS